MFSISFIGTIPVELIRLARLESLKLAGEPLLTGFMKEELKSFSSFVLKNLGEFPLVEGSFRNLINVKLPHGISSFDDKSSCLRIYFFVVVFYRSWNFIRFC